MSWGSLPDRAKFCGLESGSVAELSKLAAFQKGIEPWIWSRMLILALAVRALTLTQANIDSKRWSYEARKCAYSVALLRPPDGKNVNQTGAIAYIMEPIRIVSTWLA